MPPERLLSRRRSVGRASLAIVVVGRAVGVAVVSTSHLFKRELWSAKAEKGVGVDWGKGAVEEGRETDSFGRTASETAYLRVGVVVRVLVGSRRAVVTAAVVVALPKELMSVCKMAGDIRPERGQLDQDDIPGCWFRY